MEEAHVVTPRTERLKAMISEENSPLIVDYLPDLYTPVLVHCAEFQCMAYMDAKGIWRGRFNNSPVEGRVLAWSPV
jgi:hypothetical protein